MKTHPAIAGTFVVCAGLAHVSHLRWNDVDSTRAEDLRQTLPSEEALRLMSLTYSSIVADYYWLKTVNEFGDLRKHRAGYPNLIPLTERVLALDPWFKTAYLFAGTALTVNDLDPRHSVALLERGRGQRPDLWEIPFFLGFNYYYFLGDFERAAETMAAAARLPGAPALAGHLATRLASEARRPEVAIQMIDSILETVSDETTRDTYLERRRVLLVALHLQWLDHAIEAHRAHTGACPASMADLVEGGIMQAIPDEPLGGEYRLDGCHATTTSDYEELRLFVRDGIGAKP
jgi:tetratricopeptide (TPR) repeat protein